MKTELEIASAIANYITSQEGVTDFPVSLKQISDEVDTLRVRLLDELDSKGLLQKPYLNLTQVTLFDGSTPRRKVNLDLVTRVRYINVPRLYISPSTKKPAISYIGAFNGLQSYRVVHGTQREWFKKDRWIGSLPTAVIIESDTNEGYRVEFYGATPNKVRFVPIYEDPSDLEPFGYNGWKTSQEGGSLYPCPSGMVDVMIGKTVESYLRTMYRRPIQANQTVDAPGQSKGPEV